MKTPRLLFPFVLSLLLFAAPGAFAQAAKPILSLPATISKPGRYLIKQSLSLKKSAAAAITILSNDVILDLGGNVLSHTLPAGTDVTGIVCQGFGGIKVFNGSIRGFGTGIRLNSVGATASGVAVEDVRVQDSATVGIELLGMSASVRRCLIANTGSVLANSATGLFLDVEFATVLDNDILSTLAAPGLASLGIHSGVQAGVIENNRILNQQTARGSTGIFAAYTSNYLVENNRIAGFATGLKFTGSGTPKYRNNFTTDCATPYASGTDAGNNK